MKLAISKRSKLFVDRLRISHAFNNGSIFYFVLAHDETRL